MLPSSYCPLLQIVWWPADFSTSPASLVSITREVVRCPRLGENKRHWLVEDSIWRFTTEESQEGSGASGVRQQAEIPQDLLPASGGGDQRHDDRRGGGRGEQARAYRPHGPGKHIYTNCFFQHISQYTFPNLQIMCKCPMIHSLCSESILTSFMCVSTQYSKSYLLKTTNPVPRCPSLACLPLLEAMRCVRGPELVHLRHLRRSLLQPQVPGGASGVCAFSLFSRWMKYLNSTIFIRILAGSPQDNRIWKIPTQFFFSQNPLLCKDKIRGSCPSIRPRPTPCS